jgi:hypothetical protein
MSNSLHSIFIENRPTELWQPDGTVIKAYVTGDAYHRRFHDKDGFTMIRDDRTGIIC